MMRVASLQRLPAFDTKTGDILAVIETPQSSRNKYKYDPDAELFRLHKVLPIGAVFPFEFGFIPSTVGEDGDPVDVLVLMAESSYPGCVVAARLIGAIEAEQTEEGKTIRNDRLVAVASLYPDYAHVRSLKDLGDALVKQIEHFFISYNQIFDREFRPLGRAGAERARSLVEEGVQRARHHSK